MFNPFNRSALFAQSVEVQPASMSDRATLFDLTEHSHRAHFNLDWWTFDNWLYPDRPSDAIWLARCQGQPVGLLLAPYDAAPSVWARALAVANGWPAEPILTALLAGAQPALRSAGAEILVTLAHPDWLTSVLPRLNFSTVESVVTYRKSDRALPAPARWGGALIRAAAAGDVPAIVANDRAAFPPLWWHSPDAIDHILRTVSHFVVAEIDGRVVGHAFTDVYGGQGHLIRLVVHPQYQRRGIGEQLLIDALEYQLRADAYPFTLNTQRTNLPSQALYRRYGYREVGRPVAVMGRALDAAL